MMAGKKRSKPVYKCNGCGGNVTKTQDSIQCYGGCKGWFHKNCTRLSSKEYEVFRKKQDKWFCYICSASTASEEDSETDSSPDESEAEETKSTSTKRHSTESKKINGNIEAILKKSNPSNKELLLIFMKKFEDMEESVKFTSDLMDSMQSVLKSIQNENKKLRKEHGHLKAKVMDLENELAIVKKKLNKEEIESKASNVIVVGLDGGDSATNDVKKVFRKLNFTCQDDEYTVHALQGPLERKPVLIKFKNPELRSHLLELRKKKSTLETSECGLAGDRRNIYINEDLPAPVRELFKEARKLKNHGFRYVWCKMGRIYARKDDGHPLVKIFSATQINELLH